MNKYMSYLAAVAWANGGTLRRANLDEALGDPSYSLDDIEDLKGELHYLEHEFFKTGVTSEYDL